MNNEFKENKLILNLVLIGMVRCLHLGKMTYGDAHCILLCPGGLDRISKNKDLKEFYDIIEEAMGLDDHFSLLGLEKYLEEVVDIEKKLIDKLTSGDYEQLHKASCLLTSLKSI